MFFKLAKQALLLRDPQQKTHCVNELYARLNAHNIAIKPDSKIESIEIPGRPSKPELVHPSQVTRRKLNTEQGRVALIHAICHIEFNAINLALDAVYRFQTMPHAYYVDWLQVAVEEAKHFGLLSDRLNEFDCQYGDYCAHNGLWEMALKTQHSVVERMALVPRVLEARGLDVTPGMITRLETIGDHITAAVLEIILHDEIGHVEIGSKWFRYACAQEGLDSEETFIHLLEQYNVTTGKGPLHMEARKKAGFQKQELHALRQLNAPH